MTTRTLSPRTISRMQARHEQLGHIHMAKAALGLTDRQYRNQVMKVSGFTRTSAELDKRGRERLIKHFVAQGWQGPVAS